MSAPTVRHGSAAALAVALAVLAAPAPSSADIWAHVDADGAVRYSDSREGSPTARLVVTEAGRRADAPRPVPPVAAARDRLAAAVQTPGRAEVDAIATRIAREHDVDPALVRAVIDVESGYRPAAVSPKGATGLMQLMPATGRRFGVVDPTDPADNIGGGVRYLRHLLELFDGQLALALAAYNAGEGAVMRYGRRIPPYAETQNYVPAVLERYRSLKGNDSGAVPRM